MNKTAIQADHMTLVIVVDKIRDLTSFRITLSICAVSHYLISDRVSYDPLRIRAIPRLTINISASATSPTRFQCRLSPNQSPPRHQSLISYSFIHADQRPPWKIHLAPTVEFFVHYLSLRLIWNTTIPQESSRIPLPPLLPPPSLSPSPLAPPSLASLHRPSFK